MYVLLNKLILDILVNMLKKEKKRAQDAINQLEDSGPRMQRSVSHDQQLSNGIDPAYSTSRTRHQSDVHKSHDRSHDHNLSSRSSTEVEKSVEASSSSYRLKDSKRKLLGNK